jgi:hypothetical protein
MASGFNREDFMDQSKALQRLTESADLVGMVEELVRASQGDKLSPATFSGMRITLRNIREAILTSHDVLAGQFISRTRGRSEVPGLSNSINQPQPDPAIESDQVGNPVIGDPSRLGIRRQSLRASLEKVSEENR